MCVLPQLTQTRLIKQIESAAAVFLSPSHRYELSPTQLAQLRGVARSTIYRQAHWFQTQLQAMATQKQLSLQLSIENHALKRELHLLKTLPDSPPSEHCVKVNPEKLALTVLELAARHNSISDIQAITQLAFDLPKPPSDGTINNIIKLGATLADQILESVQYHFPLDAIAFVRSVVNSVLNSTIFTNKRLKMLTKIDGDKPKSSKPALENCWLCLTVSTPKGGVSGVLSRQSMNWSKTASILAINSAFWDSHARV